MKELYVFTVGPDFIATLELFKQVANNPTLISSFLRISATQARILFNLQVSSPPSGHSSFPWQI